MTNKKPIYVIGHRNPDTDSICSAIGYAALKNALGEEKAIAARAGEINAETSFALDYFQVKAPQLVTDLYPRVEDIMTEVAVSVSNTDSLHTLGVIMSENNLRSIPVNDEGGKLVGIVSVSDLAQRYFQELNMQNLADAGVRIREVINTLKGSLLVNADENAVVTGTVRIIGSKSGGAESIVAGDIVVINSCEEEYVLPCLNENISCLIINGIGNIPQNILDVAKIKGINVVSTELDSYTVARLINQCVPVSKIMKSNMICFNPSSLISDIKGKMMETNFRNYPVVENGKIVGIVSRDNSLEPALERVILVDHNERGQAVEGIENAKILEIIDHHRLGGLETSEPMYMREEPVGCTATIIANMYWQHDIELAAPIAGLLLSAIISDTVLFKSPTCTVYDKKTAERLAEIAGVSIQKYGMDMLKAGSGIGDMTPLEVAKNDLKEFKIGDYGVIVSQISVIDTKEVIDLKAQILDGMKTLCEKGGFDMSLLMVTDIIEESTELFFVGSPKTLIGEAFKQDASGDSIYLPGVMSRKKQIIPPLSEAVKRLKK